MQSRIMYMECKAGSSEGSGRIGRVTFSRTGRSVYYRQQRFERIAGGGIAGNYRDVENGDEYWISGCKREGGDTLFGGSILIDEDVCEEYWTKIRGKPGSKSLHSVKCPGKRR